MVFMGDPKEGVVSGGPRQQPRYYRRIPTTPQGVNLPGVGPRTRGYYDYLTGNTLTEHQYLRRYRRGLDYTVTTPQGQQVRMPAATPAQIQEQTQFNREYTQIRRERRQQGYTLSPEGISQAEYNRLNNDRLYYEYLKNQYRRSGQIENYQALIAPGGPFARLLEDMGLRPPDSPWAVGESDQQPGWPTAYTFNRRAA